MAMVVITLKDLKTSENSVARATRKAATQEKRLMKAKEAVEAARTSHAALVAEYGKQAE